MYAILFFILVSQHVATDNASCKHWFDTHMSQTNDFDYYSHLVVRIKFRTSDELKINCTNALSPLQDKTVYMLSLYPERSGHTLYSFDLDIAQLVGSFNFTENRRVSIYNLHGFNPTYRYMNNQVNHLFVFNSKFDFYLNETTQITRELCGGENFHQSSVFTGLSVLYVHNTVYTSPVCPYVFSNGLIQLIYLTDIANSLIYKNELKFMDVNENVMSVRSLSTLGVEATYIHLTKSHIHPELFKDVENLVLCCYIYSIDETLFSSFGKLKSITLDMEPFDLYLSVGFKWLHSLNTDINLADSSSSVVVTSAEKKRVVFVYFTDTKFLFKKFYAYPDRDLCFFSEFPTHRLVYPILTSQSSTLIECTCTVMWLLQYSKYVMTPDYATFYESVNTANLAVQHCLRGGDEYIANRTRECNFAGRLGKCFDKKRQFQLHGWSLRPLLFDYKWMQYVIQVYVEPIMCILSVTTNLLTICVIQSKKALHLKQSIHSIMYQHITVNSVFNILYSLIKLLSLVNICIFPRSSFCSLIYQTNASQYFKIYMVYFLGNAARLCANTSYMAFSVSRYILSTSNPSRFFKKFEQLNLRRFYSLMSLFALGFSSYKIFQFKVNDFFPFYETNYPFDAYGINYCHYNLPIQIPKWNSIAGFKCYLFNILNMANNILNNMVFFFVSILIDVGLIRFTKKNLARKRTFYSKEDAPGLVQAVKFKEKINRMVITNGILYFVSHAPEFVVILLLLVYKNGLSYYCTNYFSCNEFVEMAQAFNFFSIGFQFFVFKNFDKHFRECLHHMLGKVSPVHTSESPN